MNALKPWLPALLFMGVIFALSSQPNPLPFVPRGILTHDKLLHALAYAVLGLLVCRALLAGGVLPRRAVLLALLIASAYGITDEIHQMYVPNREADVADWAADTIGAALGALLAAYLRRRRPAARARA